MEKPDPDRKMPPGYEFPTIDPIANGWMKFLASQLTPLRCVGMVFGMAILLAPVFVALALAFCGG